MNLDKLLKEKVEELNKVGQEIQGLQERLRQVQQKALRLDGAISLLKELGEKK